MQRALNLVVLFFILFINGCAIGSLDFTDDRKIIIEPKHIEISGDIEISDWKHIKKIHDLVITEKE